MRHEDALLLRRLAQHNAPALAVTLYSMEDESGVDLRWGRQHVCTSALVPALRALARAIPRLRPILRCRGCGASRPREEFWNLYRDDPTRKQRLCKDCAHAARLAEYQRDPATFRRREKLYRLRSDNAWDAERAQRHREAQRARRLAVRLARAELLLQLCAQHYGVPPEALRGRRPIGKDDRRSQAQVAAVRLIRALTVLHPAAIAELLECTEQDIAARLRASRRWTHHKSGDVRVRDTLERIRAAYRRQLGTLPPPKARPYYTYSAAQRLSGRSCGKKEKNDEEPCA